MCNRDIVVVFLQRFSNMYSVYCRHKKLFMGCQAHQARITGIIVITEIEFFHKLELILIPIICLKRFRDHKIRVCGENSILLSVTIRLIIT